MNTPTTPHTPNDLVLCVSPDGWSLHEPGASDAAIAEGDAPYLLTGPSEGPTDEERAAAFAVYLERVNV